MDKQAFFEQGIKYVSSSELNYIPKEKALSNQLAQARIFDEPIMGVADAHHDEFKNFKKDNVIGDHFILPHEWLPNAKSVISFFFPFTKAIRDSNKQSMDYPSDGWLHGRIEGQHFINRFSADMVDLLKGNQYEAVSPSIDERFVVTLGSDDGGLNKPFTSNWSERHVAYVCGLGTFSLSKGLITEKGMAGRLTSIVTELYIPPDDRKFQSYDENCVMCGKCVKNCPVNAISFEYGKNHEICSAFLDAVSAEKSPWYGCGKCQVGVPCENQNPKS